MNPKLLFKLISEKIAAEYHRYLQWQNTSLTLEEFEELDIGLMEINRTTTVNGEDFTATIKHLKYLIGEFSKLY